MKLSSIKVGLYEARHSGKEYLCPSVTEVSNRAGVSKYAFAAADNDMCVRPCAHPLVRRGLVF